MKTQSFFTLAIFIAATTIQGGCSGRQASTEAEVTDTVTVAEIAPDTVTAIDSLPEISQEELARAIPSKKFATADEAIDFMKNSGQWDKYKDGIIVKLASQDMAYTNRLLANKYDYFIIVDKPSMYVVLYDSYGVEQKAYRMACSRKYGTKHAKRDNRTPEGFFSAEGIYDSTEWLYTDDDGKTSPIKGQFGPRFIRLKTDVTSQIGIHGTCAPWSLGRRASHGCIRINNDAIMELVEYVTPGMPIIVNPSSRDQAVNINEGYEDITKINIGKVKEKYIDPESIKEKEVKPDSITTDSIRADTVSTLPAAVDSIAKTPSEPASEVPDSIPTAM